MVVKVGPDRAVELAHDRTGWATGWPGAGASASAGVDTRRLTRAIRQQGAPHVALQHAPDGKFDLAALVAAARGFEGLVGRDLARDVTCAQSYRWTKPAGPGRTGSDAAARRGPRVVAVDYGAKRNILRCLASAGCDVTVLPATASAEDVLAHDPQGVFLSNGPGDPAATGDYAVPMIRAFWRAICRFSASASGTRCWRWRLAGARSR